MGLRDFPFLHKKKHWEESRELPVSSSSETLYSTDLDDEKDNREGHVHFLNGEWSINSGPRQ